METVRYDLLCLKSKMSNKRRGKTYVLLNSGLLSEKTIEKWGKSREFYSVGWKIRSVSEMTLSYEK